MIRRELAAAVLLLASAMGIPAGAQVKPGDLITDKEADR